ncbi:MAG: hypothetical protein ACRD8O_07005 [Bryobacteraceae bacterium]
MWLVNKTACSLTAIALAWASFSACTFLPKASGNTAAKPAAAAAPKPDPPAALPEAPIAELQTTADLPSPQPISQETLAMLNRLPAPVKETPPPPPPRRLAAPVKVEVTAPAPPAAQPAPPPTTAAKPRIRPAESEAEQRRLRAEIDTWRRETEANLGKARGRQLSGEQQARVEQINGFLDQAGLALKRNELQQASSLSNRALVLSKDLIGDR